MGIRVTETKPTYFSDCTYCTPSIWPTGKTPAILNFRMRGVLWCPGREGPLQLPNEWVVHLPAVSLCHWDLVDWYGYRFTIDFGPSLTTIGVLETSSGDNVFSYRASPTGQFSYTNQLTCAAGDRTHGGTALAWYDKLAVPRTIIYDYGVHPSGKNLIEQVNCSDGNKITRLANTDDKTNTLIKHTPTLS